MFANRYTAFVDACSLVSVWRRNLLLSLAEADFLRIRWSQEVLNETESALVSIFEKKRIPNAKNRAANSVSAMIEAFPEAIVLGFQASSCALYGLPDQEDEHVLEAAIRAQSQTIVTENLKDFPDSILQQFGIEARTADDFIADTIALDEAKALKVIQTLRNRLNKPELNSVDFIKSLEAHGMFETANILADKIDLL